MYDVLKTIWENILTFLISYSTSFTLVFFGVVFFEGGFFENWGFWLSENCWRSGDCEVGKEGIVEYGQERMCDLEKV